MPWFSDPGSAGYFGSWKPNVISVSARNDACGCCPLKLVHAGRRLLVGFSIIFFSSCRERRAEQQGVCCHNEAAPYERLGEAQGHGLHTAHAGHVEMRPGDGMGLHHAQAVAGSGRSAQLPCLSPATSAAAVDTCRVAPGSGEPRLFITGDLCKSNLEIKACWICSFCLPLAP